MAMAYWVQHTCEFVPPSAEMLQLHPDSVCVFQRARPQHRWTADGHLEVHADGWLSLVVLTSVISARSVCSDRPAKRRIFHTWKHMERCMCPNQCRRSATRPCVLWEGKRVPCKNNKCIRCNLLLHAIIAPALARCCCWGLQLFRCTHYTMLQLHVVVCQQHQTEMHAVQQGCLTTAFLVASYLALPLVTRICALAVLSGTGTSTTTLSANSFAPKLDLTVTLHSTRVRPSSLMTGMTLKGTLIPSWLRYLGISTSNNRQNLGWFHVICRNHKQLQALST